MDEPEPDVMEFQSMLGNDRSERRYESYEQPVNAAVISAERSGRVRLFIFCKSISLLCSGPENLHL